jgi:glutathione S-transferase
MLKLFANKGTISVAVALVLEEIEAGYELCLIDFAANEQRSQAYLELNPKGRVPALVTAGGILTETAAILEYIAPHLLPKDAFECAKHREISYYLAATMHINHAHKLRGYRWADLETSYDDMRAKVPQTMAESCAYVEDMIIGPYIFGAQFTPADAHLFAITQWLAGDGVEIQNYPKLAQLQQSVAARPSVARMAEKGLL